MASKGKSFKKGLREYLAAEQPQAISEAVWRGLLEHLAPISESYLRELLRDTGLPFEQPFAGIRQHTFEELEESLLEMQRVYAEAMAAGNRERARYARRQVIAARDRAKYLARNPRTAPEKQREKEEMGEWMLVWLDNPEVFTAWIQARKRALSCSSCCGTGNQGSPSPKDDRSPE
jgi:hypothetical protein